GERPDTNTPGDYPVEVEVTYPDGSKDTTTVTVHVTPKPSNEKYEPTGGEITVEEGTPVSDEEITGKVTIPEGSNGTPSVVGKRPDTNKPDRKSTRLNSSHVSISYAVFCLKKKNKHTITI